MAAMSAEALLEKISQGHLECPICCCRFVKPKILNCLHSFCQNCLEKMTEGKPDRNVIACPVCRQKTIMSETGIVGLSNNFSLMALVDDITQQEELVKSESPNVICELCIQRGEAVARCLECREYLCQECQRAHKRMKKTTEHCIATMEDLHSGKAIFKSRLWNEIPKCKKHSSQDLFFYCQTCMTLVCAACTAVDHRAPDHKLFNIPEAITSCKEKVTKLVTEAEQRLTELKTAKEIAHKSFTDHKSMTAEKHRTITKKADEEVAKIRENERLFKEKVSQMCNEKDRRFEEIIAQHGENIEKTGRMLDSVQTVMAQINDFDFLKLQQNLLKNLQDASKLEDPAPVDGLTFEDFQQCQRFSDTDLGILFKEEQAAKRLTGPEQAKMMRIGTRVVPGQDWEKGYGDQIGEGIILRMDIDTVKVKWTGGEYSGYRMGKDGKYDLQLAKESHQ